MHLPKNISPITPAMRKLCLLCLLPAAGLTSLPAAAQLTTSVLTVEVAGIQNSEGQICISLFSSGAGFPDNENAIAQEQCTPALATEPLTASADQVPSEEPLADIPDAILESMEERAEENTAVPEEGASEENPSEEASEEASEESSTEESASTPSADVVITDAIFTVTFTDIEPGTYAISVLHDENEDKTLNTGTFGIPSEGFGFSGNPEIRTGPPDFSDAAIVVIGPEASTQVELIYY